jgi:hypothetical protein
MVLTLPSPPHLLGAAMHQGTPGRSPGYPSDNVCHLADTPRRVRAAPLWPGVARACTAAEPCIINPDKRFCQDATLGLPWVSGALARPLLS